MSCQRTGPQFATPPAERIVFVSSLGKSHWRETEKGRAPIEFNTRLAGLPYKPRVFCPYREVNNESI